MAGKIVLLFVACFVVQATLAWPHFSISKWTNVGYDVTRTANDAERDIRKDLLNAKNKIWRETSKMINKGRIDESMMSCVIEVQVSQLQSLDDTSVNAMQCIDEVRVALNDITDSGRPELIGMKNEFKNRIKNCRNEAKGVFKTSQRQFNQNAMNCMIRA